MYLAFSHLPNFAQAMTSLEMKTLNLHVSQDKNMISFLTQNTSTSSSLPISDASKMKILG